MAGSEVPDFYADQFRVNVAPFGCAMTFGLSDAHPSPGQMQPAQDIARIRMSLEHLKVMTMLLKRQLKAYEEQSSAPINIPRQVYNSLGLSQEDW